MQVLTQPSEQTVFARFTILSLIARALGSSSLTVWTRPPMARTILLPCCPRVTMSLAPIIGKKVDWMSGCDVNRLLCVRRERENEHQSITSNFQVFSCCAKAIQNYVK